MRLPLLVLLALLALPSFVSAELPPFELVRQAVEERRAKDNSGTPMQVTVLGTHVRNYDLLPGNPPRLTFDDGAISLGEDSGTPYRLLWVALFADDPVRALSRYGLVNTRQQRVGVRAGEFVYEYGTSPRIGVYRDLRRLAWFEVTEGDTTWRVECDWAEERLVGVSMTKGGAPYLSAREKR